MDKQERISSRLILASLLVGAVAKLFGAIVYAFIFVTAEYFPYESVSLDTSVPNSLLGLKDNYEWNYSLYRLFIVLIVAPILENLIFPLCKLIFKSRNLLIIISITTVAFFFHGGQVHGINGASGFFVFCLFYLFLTKSQSPRLSYWYSVIAHFSSNILALIYSISM